jgi:hypothetical protein
MARTGPQRYPGASTAYWYQTQYGGDSMESNVVCWHTTEGTSLPSYAGGAEAPNFTAKPDFAAKHLVWYQHFDFDTSSRALVNLAGGVETNTLNVCQIEIVGTSDPTTHEKWRAAGYAHLFTPELPDWAIRDLAAFAKWAHDNHGVPLASDVTFKAYPGSYGTSNGVRMSAAKWQSFTGHCGHQHVPENLHGDPGLLPVAAILTAAKGGTTPAQEDDVALTADDITKVAAAVYAKLLKTDDVLTAPADASDYATNKFWTWQTHIQDVTTRVRDLGKKVDGLSKVELTDSQVATLAAAVAANPALAERIAELVATKLAARLAQ